MTGGWTEIKGLVSSLTSQEGDLRLKGIQKSHPVGPTETGETQER